MRLFSGFLSLSLSLCLCLVTGLKPAAAAEVGVTDQDVTIGSCAPLSGLLATRGRHLQEGARVYFSYINDEGGVNGRKIKLVTCDDQYDPEKAIECYNSCLKEKVFAGAFFIGSAAISKYLRMTEVEKMPMLGIYTGNPAAYEFRKNVFTFRPSYVDEVRRQLDELWKHDIKRIAVIYQNDAAGAGVRETVAKDLQARGTVPVAEGSFPRTDIHIEPTLAQVKAAKPEAVIVVGAAGTIQTIKKRYEQKWGIPFCTYDVQRPYFDGTKEGEGILATHVLPSLTEKLSGVELYNKLMAKYAPDSKPNEPGFEGFLNARVLVEGLKKAGKDLTRDKFIAGLESLKRLDLGLGPNWLVSYNATNHNGLTHKAVWLSIMRDGKYFPLSTGDWKAVVKNAKAGVN